MATSVKYILLLTTAIPGERAIGAKAAPNVGRRTRVATAVNFMVNGYKLK
jgi:hypothetical protein